MAATKHVRRSVSLPAPIAKQVDRLAKSQRLSDNRVLVELIELGIEARKQKEEKFFAQLFDIPGYKHPCQHNKCCEQDHGHRYPVDSDVIIDMEGSIPGIIVFKEHHRRIP